MSTRKLETAAVAVAVCAVAALGYWVATGTDPLGVLGALRGTWDALSAWLLWYGSHVTPVEGIAFAVVLVAAIFAIRGKHGG